jgi:IS5 family transposase
MKHWTLASQASFEKYGRKSRRELFLDEVALVVPWAELEALVEPHYPKAGNGRRPMGLPIMLRTYFIQQWFKLSARRGRSVLRVGYAAPFRGRGSRGGSGAG